MLPINESASSVCESTADYIFTGLMGFFINTAKRLAHQLRLRRELDQLTRAFRILTGDPNFNPNSGKQVSTWLYEGLLYPVRDTTDSGAPATDATTLYKLLADHPKNVALQFLLEIKETSKRLSSLGYEPFIQPKSRG
jgi:DNA polymerase I-like protein with 3'-5' exonuclease and polymerase domains